MKSKLLTRVPLFLATAMLLITSQVFSQISVKAPEPADNPNLAGNSPWTAICAGVGGFNQYYAKISWAGTANPDNEFILELSDPSGNFTSAVELARASDQNTNNPKEFDLEFSIPTTTRGDSYKMRVRSTSPADEEESVDAFNMYYMDVTTNINISELGDGNPPGSLCAASSLNLQVDNIPNPETYQYIWYRSGTELTTETSSTLNVTQSGMYQAYIDYGDICTGSGNTDSNIVTVTIGSTGPGIGITPPSKTALCAGETETLTIDTTDPSWNYQWYKDDTVISGATTTSYLVDANVVGFEGDYQVEISSPSICTQRSVAVTMTNADNFTVTRDNPANIVVLPTGPETLSITTNAISPTFQWYRNGSAVGGATGSTLDITQDGAYYAEVTQAGGTCPGTMRNSENTVAVVPASFEIITDYNGTYVSCVSTDIILEVATINAVATDGSKTDVTTQLESSFAYQWQKDGVDVIAATGQNISLTNTTENGDYTVDASLSTYNETSNTLTVQLITSETVTISSSSTIYCNSSDTITISTTTDLSAETFRWERDATATNTTDVALIVTAPGTYRLVLDKNGCDLFSNEIVISPLDPNLISLDVDGDVIFPEGSSKTVRASGGTSYQWFDSNNTLMSSDEVMNFTEEGDFLLIANIDNCEVSRSITATYLDLFNVPNVITPNGDGANDQWVIPNSYSNKSDVSVIIYNTNGEELYNQTNYQNSWPGSTMTFLKQSMVFYYVIKNTNETLKQGTITVIR
jgi:gliding motility-associated-like protein